MTQYSRSNVQSKTHACLDSDSNSIALEPRLACRCTGTMGMPLRRSDSTTVRDKRGFTKSEGA
jgi:hypothetical protein